MTKDFQQLEWNEALAEDCRRLVRLAVREDLDAGQDLTTVALVTESARGEAAIVAREAGIVAGLPAVEVLLDETKADLSLSVHRKDSCAISAGETMATVAGSTCDLLRLERPLLNFLGWLCGIATLTGRFVRAVGNTEARIYDTRKTTPGWRRLEKYAVRCGGGFNHRMGLFDAVLIKDNHLAARQVSPAQAVKQACAFLTENFGPESADDIIVEIEVDSVEQLEEVLPAKPDLVLLDNFTIEELVQAVALRDSTGFTVELEASGGVAIDTVAAIARTGVERISAGALTHSAGWLDVALDWRA